MAFLVLIAIGPAGADEISNCTGIASHVARLQCFDAAIPRCLALGNPDKRLSCFDTVTTIHAVAAVPEAMRTARPERNAAESGSGIRISAGGGVNVGDHAGRFKALHGDLNLHSFLGSSGSALSAQLWWDGAFAKNWTVGAQWLKIRSAGKAALNLPYLDVSGIRISPVSLDAQARISADLAFLNIAYRPAHYVSVHPFIGVGVGGGFGRASFDYNYDLFGTGGSSTRVSSAVGAVQAFMGLDFDITRSIYLSLSPGAVLVSGHPVGLNQRYLDLSMLATLGARLP